MNTRIGMISSLGAEAAATNREWRGGYTVGGGLEYAFSYSWSAKFEYQYIDFGSSTTSAPEIFRGIPWNTFISTNTRHDFNTFRVGLNYKWGQANGRPPEVTDPTFCLRQPKPRRRPGLL